jgi:hypothetical protein
MSYGRLTPLQMNVLGAVIDRRAVTDLGAGSCALAVVMLGLGAKHVTCIDKELRPIVRQNPNIWLRDCSFDTVSGDVDVAFVSWPMGDPTLLPLVERAKTVVLLVKNTDGRNCGFPLLYAHTAFRELLAYVPDRANSLIVCEAPLKNGARMMTPEEHAGFDLTKIYSYEEGE